MSNLKVKKINKANLHFLHSAFLLILLILVPSFGFLLKTDSVKASTCSASVATITKTSSPVFYIDSPNYNYAYTSFKINTGASGSFTDLWVKMDTFTNSALLGLAETEDGLYHIGKINANSTAYVYFYLKGAETASAQSYTLHLYEGKPSNAGVENCSSSQSNTSVATTIESGNNTVSSVSYTAPYIGGGMTMTIIGDTGTIGTAKIFSYTPATKSTWNADCLKLTDATVTFTGGNTGTLSHDLYKVMTNTTTTHYVITYYFTPTCTTASSTPVVPMTYISSGAQVKHTSVGNYGTLPPIAPAQNSIILSKSASPSGSISGGTTTYNVDVINSGPISVTLDDFEDDLPTSPASVTYQAGTSYYDTDIGDGVNSVSVPNPSQSGNTLTWNGTFVVPAGKTGRLTYQITVPSTPGNYINSVIAHSGDTQIDQTIDTSDNSPATSTYGIGDPNLSKSTKTVSDLNGGLLQPGDVLEYTINVIHGGTLNATGVHVHDALDLNTDTLTGLEIGANGSDCGTSYVDNSTGTVLDVTNITLHVGDTCIIKFRATVKSSTPDNTTILNSASIVPGNAGGIGGYPSSTPLTVQIKPVLALTISEDDSDNVVLANQVITYTIKVSNSGLVDATGIDLTDTITGPVDSAANITKSNCGTEFVDTSSGASIAIAGLQVVKNGTCTITFTVTVNAGVSSGSVNSSADVKAAREGGNNPDAVSASTLLIGATPTPPNLTVTISDNDVDDMVIPGQSVTYTITISNSGQTDASTSMTSVIPAGMGTPGSFTYTNCGSASSTYSQPNITTSSITVNAGSTCTVTFTTTINTPTNEGTTFVASANVAQASQGGNDPAAVNSATLTVDATPNLALNISVDDADFVLSRNQIITYTITISNTGDGQATGVNLTDLITGETGNVGNFTYTNCGSSYDNASSGKNVAINNLTITTTANCVITYKVTVNSDAANNSTITDSVDIDVATEGGNNLAPQSANTLTVNVVAPTPTPTPTNTPTPTPTPTSTPTPTPTPTNSPTPTPTSAPSDVTPPTITNINSTTLSSNATITWDTDENASSKIEYGLIQSYGFATGISDTSPYVKGHSVTINDLKPCARYFYRIVSTDSSGNSSYSNRKTFTTNSCSTSHVIGGNENKFTEASGGLLNHTRGNSSTSLNIPANFSNISASFQINEIDVDGMAASPSGKALVDSNIYELLAVDDSNTQITEFTNDIVFTIKYAASIQTIFEENTLDIYLYSGGNWVKQNCTLDTNLLTVTCSLPHFSIYALFGSLIPSSTPTPTPTPISTPTPTLSTTIAPTPTPSLVPVTSTNSNSPSCQSQSPTSASNLFQATSFLESILLYFTPVSPVSSYIISYGIKDNTDMYSVTFPSGIPGGVVSYLISGLSPNTNYSFKVSGLNDCQPGLWSNIFTALTTSPSAQKNTIVSNTDTINDSPPKSDNPSTAHNLIVIVRKGGSGVQGAEITVDEYSLKATTDQN